MPFAFDPNTTHYRPGNAYWMAVIAKEAYDTKKDGSPDLKALRREQEVLKALKTKDDGFKKVHAFDVSNSQGLVVKHSDYIAVAFRGTDEAADWLDNVNAFAIDYPFGKVHRGFQSALRDIWPQMKTAIRDEQPKKRRLPIWITGHSLGGALAVLAASQMVVGDEPFYGVYTFGQPRVGDREFGRVYNVEAGWKTFRFQNNADIVTRVPARLMGYSHVGRFVYIDDNKKVSADKGFWYTFLDTVRSAMNDLLEVGLEGVKDHSISAYVEALESWGDKDPEGGFR
jgi:triacylglycerol lipase